MSDTPSRPPHHRDALADLEFTAEIAELYTLLEEFQVILCRSIGIRDAETLITVVQEKARRAARRRLAGMVRDAGLMEAIQAKIAELVPRVESA